jgi:hypothetical protein
MFPPWLSLSTLSCSQDRENRTRLHLAPASLLIDAQGLLPAREVGAAMCDRGQLIVAHVVVFFTLFFER